MSHNKKAEGAAIMALIHHLRVDGNGYPQIKDLPAKVSEMLFYNKGIMKIDFGLPKKLA